MYHEVSIAKLSPVQHSRLRNGHGVRCKVGNDHVIHVSAEQQKKLHRAHAKGMSVVLRMDPFQQHHLKGKGISDEQFTGNDVAKFVGAKESKAGVMNKPVTLREAGNAAKRCRSLFRPW